MRQDIFQVGFITFNDEILNEDEVTTNRSRFRPKKIGECKVKVYGPNEGQIPHFDDIPRSPTSILSRL